MSVSKLDKLQLLGLILDNSVNEVYIFNVDDYNFTYLNKGAIKNIGYSLEEMLNMTPFDIKPSISKYQFKNILSPLLDGSMEEVILETIHERKDGTRYDVEARIQLVEVDDTKQFVVNAMDITQRKEIELKLKESEEQFRTIAESSLLGIFIYKDTFKYVNQALVDMSGYSVDELLSMEPWELMDSSVHKKTKDIISRRLSGEQFPTIYDDLALVGKNGERKIARVITRTIKYKDGYAGLGMLIDITDIKETKQNLKMLVQAIEQTNELIMITDNQGKITYVNEAYVAHSGYKQHDLIGKNPRILKSDKHDKAFYKDLWETISNGNIYSNIIINRKKDGQLYHAETTISPIYDDKGIIQNYISTSRDISSRIKMEKELILRATTDDLTKIYNRYYGNEILDREIEIAERHGNSFAILMFDIDDFKLVNDTYGHDVGDKVLKKLTQVVSMHLRRSDTFIRWGGEEFLVVAVHINKDEAIKFANKLRIAVESYEFDSDLSITISIGVSVSQLEDTKEDILKRVDDALYNAKGDGKNCVKFI